MNNPSQPGFHVIADSFQLENALRQIAAMKGADRMAKFACDNDGLRLVFGFGTFRVACNGRFSGVVKCERKAIHDLVKRWRVSSATIDIVQLNGELRIGAIPIKCSIESPLGQAADEMPILGTETARSRDSVTLLALLAAARSNSAAELQEVYAAAQVKADSLISQAAGILKPLEIKKSDIEQLVQANIRRLEAK